MHRRAALFTLCLISFASLPSCAFTRSRPCSKAGDTTWYPPITGNMQCYQMKTHAGTLQNHGQFRQHYPSGKLALEGEFHEGKKNGLWVQYDEQGNRVLERWYESGVERSIPDSARKLETKARP